MKHLLIATVAALVAPVAGLSGTSDDLDEITVTALPLEDIDGLVADVSTTGNVLVVGSEAAPDDAVVVLDLTGEEVARWTVPDPPVAVGGSNWSPDGSVVAFDQLTTEDGSMPKTSVARTLDVVDGTLTEIGPISDGLVSFDYFPAWSDDGDLLFLRGSALPAGLDQPVELVTWSGVDGKARSAPVELTPSQFNNQEGAVLAGRFVVTIAAVNGADVVAIDADGSTEVLMSTVYSNAIARGASNDGRLLLVTPLDTEGLEIGPLTLLEDGEDPREASQVNALDAVFQPGSQLVAALGIYNPGPNSTAFLTLWDPNADRMRSLYNFDVDFDPFAIVWTTDDQIVAWSLDQFQVLEVDTD